MIFLTCSGLRGSPSWVIKNSGSVFRGSVDVTQTGVCIISQNFCAVVKVIVLDFPQRGFHFWRAPFNYIPLFHVQCEVHTLPISNRSWFFDFVGQHLYFVVLIVDADRIRFVGLHGSKQPQHGFPQEECPASSTIEDLELALYRYVAKLHFTPPYCFRWHNYPIPHSQPSRCSAPLSKSMFDFVEHCCAHSWQSNRAATLMISPWGPSSCRVCWEGTSTPMSHICLVTSSCPTEYKSTMLLFNTVLITLTAGLQTLITSMSGVSWAISIPSMLLMAPPCFPDVL